MNDQVLPGDLFAFYGILRGNSNLSHVGRFMGDCRIPGRMYNCWNSYPALVPPEVPEDTVVGQLWCSPLDPLDLEQCVHVLDELEMYTGDPDSSMYVRKRTKLLEPERVAWVYVYNYPYERLARVPEGDWRAFRNRYLDLDYYARFMSE